MSLFKLSKLLFNCKPLMPKNPFKRLVVLLNYIRNASKESQLTFSLPGDIILKVNDVNYKIINYNNDVIYTVVSEKNEEVIDNILKFNNDSQMYEKIIDVDKERRIITGKFYNGHHPDLTKYNRKLTRKMNQLFLNLISESELKVVDIKSYSASLLNDIELILDKNSTIIDEWHINYIKEFATKTYSAVIKSGSEKTIPLTLSHGDIKRDNIISYKSKLVLIDWEFCAYRSPTFDILKFISRFSPDNKISYCVLLSKIKILNQTPRKKLESEIEIYLDQNTFTHLNLYYLEDILLRLRQFEKRDFAADATKIIKSIERGIKYY